MIMPCGNCRKEEGTVYVGCREVEDVSRKLGLEDFKKFPNEIPRMVRTGVNINT